jgi:hypothetical protein
MEKRQKKNKSGECLSLTAVGAGGCRLTLGATGRMRYLSPGKLLFLSLLVLALATASTAQLTSSSTRSTSPISLSAPAYFDGPAELPRLYLRTSIMDTPAPGAVLTVRAGEDIQSTLEVARCGDTVELQAGSTYAGEFRLPAKTCDDQHWIIIRSSSTALPPEGTRLTPCYAGVSGLPGRPPLNCISTKNVVAKLAGNPPLASRGPVNHYRLVGVELAQPEGSSASTLLDLAIGSHHIVIDRCWIHGNARDNAQRGTALNGSSMAVVDSTVTDIHMVETDTQGIAAWTGTGPLKIVNNFIEGGSSSIGFGGAASTTTPKDIEVRQNHLFKPTSWRVGSPDFIGVTFNCKVAFESKNSSRVLIEGNILENVWGGRQGSDGNALWLGPKNQNNACPSCEVNDITLRYNLVRHAGGGPYIFDAPSDAGGIARPAMRYSIHDNLFEDITSAYAGAGTGDGILFRFYGSAQFPPPRDITIQHNTGINNGEEGGVLSLLTTPDAPLVNFVFRDNLVGNGETGISGCKGRTGEEVLGACAPRYVFVNNVVVGSSDSYPKSNTGAQKAKNKQKLRLYPKDWRAVGFSSYAGGDYRLCSGAGEPSASCAEASRYAHAGTDGKDIGADLSTVYRMTKAAE